MSAALLDLGAARSRHAGRVAERAERNAMLHERREAEALAELRRGRVRLLRELESWPSAFERRLRARVERIAEPDVEPHPWFGHEARGAAVFEACLPESYDLELLKLRRRGVERGGRHDTFEMATARCVADLRAAVRALRDAEVSGNRRRVGQARAKVSRAKSELLWALFSFGRTAPLARGAREA